MNQLEHLRSVNIFCDVLPIDTGVSPPKRRKFTQEEERLVLKHFRNNIAERNTPSLFDCQEFLLRYAHIHWVKKQIQDKVKNIIKSK